MTLYPNTLRPVTNIVIKFPGVTSVVLNFLYSCSLNSLGISAWRIGFFSEVLAMNSHKDLDTLKHSFMSGSYRILLEQWQVEGYQA